jgi:PII-like signaling protein
MELKGQSTLLRVFLGEMDKIGHKPLYEEILLAGRNQGIAGVTVLRGILSYGASTHIHTAKLLDIAEDLPVLIEIIDTEEKINQFIPTLEALFDECGHGGLITRETVNVLYYKPKNK